MANLWITEYDNAATGSYTVSLPIAEEPALANQKVVFTTATQSAGFQSATSFVRLVADADCHVQFGANPTATADMQKLIAGVEYWRAVTAGDKVSVYDDGSS